jgi:hypothetical protein
VVSVNRFAGMRLEELQGEIPSLCKDQHGCRYLQKKLEEGVPEHRDMIFRETFGHFPELMTGTSSPVLAFISCASPKLVYSGVQIPSATIYARSCWSIALMSSVT